MFSRLMHDSKGLSIPKDTQSEFTALLNINFKDSFKTDDQKFEVMGQIYENEVVLATCLYDEETPTINCLTCFLSADIKSGSEAKTHFENLMDLTGIFFDEVFNSTDWDEFVPTWQEHEFNKNTYFYKISRENLYLTTQADLLLDTKLN
jgi:hypothetical protein